MNKWTKEEISILIKHYPSIKAEGCVKLIPNKTPSQIRSKIQNMRVKPIAELTKEQKEECQKQYLSGKIIKDIAKNMKVHPKSVSKGIRDMGTSVGPRLWTNKYTLDVEAFKVIDTEEKAYWLGFIQGDGSVDKGLYSLGIELGNTDKEHLQKFLNFLKCDFIIKKTNKNCCLIRISHPEFVANLINLGIVPNKTYKDTRTPKIPKELLKHFYRGILDSDGWICKHGTTFDVGFSSYNLEFLKEINEFFADIGVKKGTLLERFRKNKTQRVCQLIFTSNKNYIKIYEEIYKDATIYLDRKYEKATEYYNLTINNCKKTW